MDTFELLDHGKCPNGHGDMVYFNHPISILHILPEELLEDLEGVDTPDNMYGYLAAICQECGFVLTVKSITNHEKYMEWLKVYRSSQRDPPYGERT